MTLLLVGSRLCFYPEMKYIYDKLTYFFLEYCDSFIIFIDRVYLRILNKYDNSPLLKQLWIIF